MRDCTYAMKFVTIRMCYEISLESGFDAYIIKNNNAVSLFMYST